MTIADTASRREDTTLRIRTTKENWLAFRRWRVKYQSETHDPDATQGEAFEELLRMVGEVKTPSKIHSPSMGPGTVYGKGTTA